MAEPVSRRRLIGPVRGFERFEPTLLECVELNEHPETERKRVFIRD